MRPDKCSKHDRYMVSCGNCDYNQALDENYEVLMRVINWDMGFVQIINAIKKTKEELRR